MIILDYPSKKLLKEEVGRPLRYIETSMFGLEYRENGTFSGATDQASRAIGGSSLPLSR